MILGKLGQHGQIGVELSHKVLLGAPLISVDTNQLYAVVAWIALQILLLSQIGCHAWRICPQQIVETISIQFVLQHVPQSLIFLGSTQFLAPPEPAAGILVPRTEDDGHFLAVGCLQLCQKIAHALHPCLKQLVLLSSFQYVLNYGCIGHVPCRSLGEFLSSQSATLDSCHRVAWVPTYGYHTTALVVLYYLVAHLGKWHAVQILLVAHLYASQFKSHHSRPVATGILHVARVGLVVPCQTVEWIVLMTKHIPLLSQSVQTLKQLLGLCFLCLYLLCCSAAGNHHRPHCHSH